MFYHALALPDALGNGSAALRPGIPGPFMPGGSDAALRGMLEGSCPALRGLQAVLTRDAALHQSETAGVA